MLDAGIALETILKEVFPMAACSKMGFERLGLRSQSCPLEIDAQYSNTFSSLPQLAHHRKLDRLVPSGNSRRSRSILNWLRGRFYTNHGGFRLTSKGISLG